MDHEVRRRSYAVHLLIGLLILKLMPMDATSYELDKWAAKIATAALLEQVHDDSSEQVLTSEPLGEPAISINGGPVMSVDSVVEQLVALNKPSACTALRYAAHGRVDFSCTEITDRNLLDLMKSRNATGDGWAEQMKTEYGVVDGDPLLSFRTQRDTFTVPLSGLRRYFVQYLILGSCTLSRPDSLARSEGASAVVKLLPPTTLEVRGF
jgi:hypothetical protein